jgi:hypothetical protein
VAANSEEEVVETTRLAPQCTKRGVAHLDPHGAGRGPLATSSVLLHFGHRDRYPILDYRALSALGVTDHANTVSFWNSTLPPAAPSTMRRIRHARHRPCAVAVVEGTRQEPMNLPTQPRWRLCALVAETLPMDDWAGAACSRRCGGAARADRQEREAASGRVAELEPGNVFAERYEIQRLLVKVTASGPIWHETRRWAYWWRSHSSGPEAVLEDPWHRAGVLRFPAVSAAHNNVVSLTTDYDMTWTAPSSTWFLNT